jgi:VWFA-related protein
VRLHPAIVAAASLVCAAAGAQEKPFRGEVEVTRIVTDVRVVDHDGTPVQGLGPADFRVTVDGRRAQVESADWLSGPVAYDSVPGGRRPTVTEPDDARREPAGRLIVLLYQIGLDFVRIDGVYRIDDYAKEFLRNLHPSDRVAVAVFTSHLQLHADFSNEFEQLCDELNVPAVVANEMVEHDGREPSLARNFDYDRAKRATNMRQALHIIADALAPYPGMKSVVLLGWGVGEYRANQGVIWLGPQYVDALEALSEARASVYSLDISTADYHTLEEGLRKVSWDTGGFYLKTHLFPGFAVDKLARTLSGHYELSVIPPEDLDEHFRVRVRVKIPGTEVHFRRVQFPETPDSG